MTLRQFLVQRYREPLTKAAVTMKIAAVAVEAMAQKLFQEVTK